MKIRLGLLLVAILVLSVAMARADTIPPGDPEVDVGGGGLSPGLGTSFSFNSSALSPCSTLIGFLCFSGFNDSGVLWSSLGIFFPSNINGVTCGASSLFSNPCQVIGNEVLFSGLPGILNQTHFTIAIKGFPDDTNFEVIANVPEPATVTLFLTGLGALIARRRLRKV